MGGLRHFANHCHGPDRICSENSSEDKGFKQDLETRLTEFLMPPGRAPTNKAAEAISFPFTCYLVYMVLYQP